jgi:hypothetical protein
MNYTYTLNICIKLKSYAHIYDTKILALIFKNQRRKKEPFEANPLWNLKKDCKCCFESMVDSLFQIAIEKLDMKIFQRWKKTKIINFLMGNDHWEFIIGETRICTPENSYNIMNSS